MPTDAPSVRESAELFLDEFESIEVEYTPVVAKGHPTREQLDADAASHVEWFVTDPLSFQPTGRYSARLTACGPGGGLATLRITTGMGVVIVARTRVTVSRAEIPPESSAMLISTGEPV